MAEEECGSAAVAEMDAEPYFVDFLREAPEPTGKCRQCGQVALLCFNLTSHNFHSTQFFFFNENLVDNVVLKH